MANIFSRNYKFDEPKVTSTQDKGYFTTEVASTDEDGKIVSSSGYVSVWKPKVMHCPDCGCPLILNNGELEFADEEATFEKIIAGIKSIRNCRGEMNVPPSVKAKLYIETAQPEVFSQGVMFFERLASASEVIITDKCEEKDCAAAVTDSARFFIPLADIIDVDKELARLDKDRKNAQKDIDFLSKKLSNQGFLAKAPAQLIEAEKAKLAKAEEKMSKIMESISALEARK